MTEQEYFKERSEINQKRDDDLSALAKRYVSENAQFNKGDIIKSPYEIILIVSVNISSLRNGTPDYYYYGIKLRKDLSPYKSGEMTAIHTHLSIEKLN